MLDLITREQWQGRRPREVTRLTVAPDGVKVHYLAGTVSPELVHDHRLCVDLVQEVQGWHMDGRGWNDTGYTALVCPHRAVFEARGPWVLPSANGSGLNAGHYALACLLGEHGLVTPPQGMLDGLADGIRWLRAEGGAGRDILGHRDGYATECPGDPLYRVVKRWQREGLPPAGPVRVPPFARILKYPPLMTGDDVRTWQQQMRRRGWAIGVDGKFGPASKAVAAAFAKEKKIVSISGQVNKAVWDAAWLAPIT
ncbi:peptidoglycan recognition protein family protein [Nonomuraea rubra]|uniref:peptidoglycan recognition protein family protein n=1 Tax=Nonomuraea rubra TaxID=46180 RepID=UPI0033E5887A